MGMKSEKCKKAAEAAFLLFLRVGITDFLIDDAD